MGAGPCVTTRSAARAPALVSIAITGAPVSIRVSGPGAMICTPSASDESRMYRSRNQSGGSPM